MRKPKSTPSRGVIRQAINVIFDHKKRQDEKERSPSPIVRIISRGGSSGVNHPAN
jgi:hypothetical protein